eukprot:g1702.t1
MVEPQQQFAPFYGERLFADIEFCFALERGHEACSSNACDAREAPTTPRPAPNPLFAHRIVLALRSEVLESCGLASVATLQSNLAGGAARGGTCGDCGNASNGGGGSSGDSGAGPSVQCLDDIPPACPPRDCGAHQGGTTAQLHAEAQRAHAHAHAAVRLRVCVHGVRRRAFVAMLRFVYGAEPEEPEAAGEAVDAANMRQLLCGWLQEMEVAVRYGVVGLARRTCHRACRLLARLSPAAAAPHWLLILTHAERVQRVFEPWGARRVGTRGRGAPPSPALPARAEACALAAGLRDRAQGALCGAPLGAFVPLLAADGTGTGKSEGRGACGGGNGSEREGCLESGGAGEREAKGEAKGEAGGTAEGEAEGQAEGEAEGRGAANPSAHARLGAAVWARVVCARALLDHSAAAERVVGAGCSVAEAEAAVVAANALVLCSAASRADVAACVLRRESGQHVQTCSDYRALASRAGRAGDGVLQLGPRHAGGETGETMATMATMAGGGAAATTNDQSPGGASCALAGAGPGSGSGLRPLEAALRTGHAALIRLLVSKGASAAAAGAGPGGGGARSSADQEHAGPGCSSCAGGGEPSLLHVAASLGDIAGCRLLLAHAGDLGLDVNAVEGANDSEDGGGGGASAASEVNRHLVAAAAGAAAHIAIASSNGGSGSGGGGAADGVSPLSSPRVSFSAASKRCGLGVSALHVASSAGHAAVVALLLRHGAVPNLQDGDGDTALHNAKTAGVVQELLNPQLDRTRRVNPELPNLDGQSALHRACHRGDIHVVATLIEFGASVRSADDKGQTPLHVAARGCHRQPGVALVLLKAAEAEEPQPVIDLRSCAPLASPPARPPQGVLFSSSPAGRAQHPPSPSGILRASYLAATDSDGNTALHVAISSRMMKLLVEQGARCNACNKIGQTPLHVLCLHGFADEGRHAADQQQDELLQEQLRVATDVVHLFCSHGVDLNAQTRAGDTALHLAVTRAGETAQAAAREEEAVAGGAGVALVGVSAGAESTTVGECTRLAAQAEALAVALVSAGALLNTRNLRGASPLDLAQRADEALAEARGGSSAEASMLSSQKGAGAGAGSADAGAGVGVGAGAVADGLVVSLLRHVSQQPLWTPDDSVSRCESLHCGKPFSVTARRHHCRHCGRIICGACAPRKMVLPQLGWKKRVRVCELCWSVLNFRKLA